MLRKSSAKFILKRDRSVLKKDAMAALICMAKKHRYVKRALNVIVFYY